MMARLLLLWFLFWLFEFRIFHFLFLGIFFVNGVCRIFRFSRLNSHPILVGFPSYVSEDCFLVSEVNKISGLDGHVFFVPWFVIIFFFSSPTRKFFEICTSTFVIKITSLRQWVPMNTFQIL